MPSSHLLIDTFLAVLRTSLARFERDDTEEGAEVGRVLGLWPTTPDIAPLPKPQHSAVAAQLASALALAEHNGAADLAAAIRPLAHRLHWTFGYPPHPQFPDLASRVAFAQLVGPSDSARPGQLLMGLTLLVPHTHYPAHQHPAHEIYLPVGGKGLWRKGASAPTPKPPGSIIMHPSNVAHATESLDEPVLAIYIWRGDLISASTFVLDSQT